MKCEFFLLYLRTNYIIMSVKKLFICIILLSIGHVLSAKIAYDKILELYNPNTEKGLIYIDKQEMTLSLYNNNGELLKEYPMACGLNKGPKIKSGDMKTPEGVFTVQEVTDASTWGHDFHDGKGFIRHAYGPWFIRLSTGKFKGIGIHGTHAPESIGTRATEGCIRLKNENLADLKPLINIGMAVVIGPESDY